MRLAKGKGYGSKEAVPRHRTQSRASSDRQERAIEKQVRREGKRAAQQGTRSRKVCTCGAPSLPGLYGTNPPCAYEWARANWGKVWADKIHPGHPHADSPYGGVRP